MLTRFFPGGATLKVNTALAVASLGVLVARSSVRVDLLVVGLFPGAGLPAVAMAEWVWGVDLGLGQLLVADPASAAAGAPPGRMAVATAAGLLLVGASLSLEATRAAAAAQICAALAFGVGWIAVLGYVHQLGPLAEVWLYGSVSLPTAVCIAALGIGCLARTADQGFLPAWTGDDAGARLMRRLGPAVWILPGLTAIGAQALSRGAGWHLGFTAVLAATATASAFTGLLAWTAIRARRAEAANQDLARRLLTLQEDERRSIALELHDEFGQSLSALGLLLDRLDAPDRARVDAREIVRTLTAGVRGLALELRPSMLDDLGLVPALQWQCDRWTEHAERPATLTVEGDVRRLPAGVETAAYRIAQEALTNAARHSGATRVSVGVAFLPTALHLAIDDDGHGFQAAGARPSLGLAGMSERAKLLGGSFVLTTGPSGTSIRVAFDLGASP